MGESMRFGVAYLTIALGVAAFANGPQAQDQNYPNRPVHILAAAAPGGNPDVLARLLSQRLSAVLGPPFVVGDVAGAGGIFAASGIAGAATARYAVRVNV